MSILTVILSMTLAAQDVEPFNPRMVIPLFCETGPLLMTVLPGESEQQCRIQQEAQQTTP